MVNRKIASINYLQELISGTNISIEDEIYEYYNNKFGDASMVQPNLCPTCASIKSIEYPNTAGAKMFNIDGLYDNNQLVRCDSLSVASKGYVTVTVYGFRNWESDGESYIRYKITPIGEDEKDDWSGGTTVDGVLEIEVTAGSILKVYSEKTSYEDTTTYYLNGSITIYGDEGSVVFPYEWVEKYDVVFSVGPKTEDGSEAQELIELTWDGGYEHHITIGNNGVVMGHDFSEEPTFNNESSATTFTFENDFLSYNQLINENTVTPIKYTYTQGNEISKPIYISDGIIKDLFEDETGELDIATNTTNIITFPTPVFKEYGYPNKYYTEIPIVVQCSNDVIDNVKTLYIGFWVNDSTGLGGVYRYDITKKMWSFIDINNNDNNVNKAYIPASDLWARISFNITFNDVANTDKDYKVQVMANGKMKTNYFVNTNNILSKTVNVETNIGELKGCSTPYIIRLS